MAKGKAWEAFPHDRKGFDFAGAKLEKAWPALHAGDCEPFPDAEHVEACLKASKQKLDAAATAGQLQEAWRAFHSGDFQQAYAFGEALGALGASVAIKAAGIHATHLLDDEAAKLKRYQQLMELAETAMAALPKLANSHFRRAFAIGRYSQSISIAKALTQGLAGKVKESLDATLKLAPKHAEAHTALGLYHAEIINKVGSMLGGLTYGAKAATGEKHLETAIEIDPKAPIAHIEYGNGLMLLYGDKREDDAAAAYERAAKLKARDAMEKLDIEFARSQLED
jgi:tetratricopeptide (TPR) repeat protein